MRLPLHDWQFYVVTLAALAGVWLVIRTLRPRRKTGGSCPSCSSDSNSNQHRKAKLTVSGKRV